MSGDGCGRFSAVLVNRLDTTRFGASTAAAANTSLLRGLSVTVARLISASVNT